MHSRFGAVVFKRTVACAEPMCRTGTGLEPRRLFRVPQMARGIDLSSLASSVPQFLCFVTDQHSGGANEAFVRHYAGGGVLLFYDCQM